MGDADRLGACDGGLGGSGGGKAVRGGCCGWGRSWRGRPPPSGGEPMGWWLPVSCTAQSLRDCLNGRIGEALRLQAQGRYAGSPQCGEKPRLRPSSVPDEEPIPGAGTQVEKESTELHYGRTGNSPSVTPKVTPAGAALLFSATAFDLLISSAVLTRFNMPLFLAAWPVSPLGCCRRRAGQAIC